MPRVQYSLASLFELTLALAAFLPSVTLLLGDNAMSPRAAATAIGCWLVLLGLYLRRRYVAVAVIHAFFVILSPIALADYEVWTMRGPEIARGFFFAIACACLLGTVLGFPVFVIRLLGEGGSQQRASGPASDGNADRYSKRQ